ncbi:putative amine oxidase [copper-containing] [Biomphalaria glabrata]|uniref:Amine oxidase n=1 Tax=Biomphalaria glabrata TaxID=6526 RepID=A0A9U8EKE0_BIOGL|nr:putative amine oxidase [copper-containing] [Biomphalaria glabrata]
MVYRSSRRPVQDENIYLTRFDKDLKTDVVSDKHHGTIHFWQICSVILVLICLGLTVAIVVLSTSGNIPDTPRCGTSKINRNFVDLSEPDKPGPFHDLTKSEMKKLREFLENDPNIHVEPAETARMEQSALYLLDLYPAKKADVIRYLDNSGPQPIRQARAIVFRGDLSSPVVEEYICGPLPEVKKCSLLKSDKRRNPVEFALRPISLVENEAIVDVLLREIDRKVGFILKESYGTSFYNCFPEECLTMYTTPMGTNLVGDISMRRSWVWAVYPVEYYALHPLDFAALVNCDGSDPRKFSVDKIWYHGKMHESVDDFIAAYNSNKTGKTRVRQRFNSQDAFSSLHQRGDLLPDQPLRPPTLVEPDGIRYTLKGRQIEYLGWSFYFRLSALTGPSFWDIRYKGERIAYELSLSEFAVFYSAHNPMQRTTDFVDSGALIGFHAKSLVPGADCPETATFINQSFSGQVVSEPLEISRALCLFENNNGYPLRRHLSYTKGEGGFYGGMLDSVLTIRCAVTIINYDYILDLILHQNGVIESRVMSTGYILPSFYTSEERPYGFQTEENFFGPVHHHMFHFKVDLDISGVSNRYETLDVSVETVDLRSAKGTSYYQTRFDRNLKKTEKEALFKFNFDKPKYHVVHNEHVKTKFGELKGYRIALDGMSKQPLPENENNEGTIAWARHQMVVTKHNDEEPLSSSSYAMLDSLNPVVNFTKFYEDDENIVDEDLVFWITSGMHHITRSEDLPLTTTVGNHLTFFLLPFNYFKECPSVASRDHIRISHKNPKDQKEGVKVERNGNQFHTCSLPPVSKEYDDLVEENPDIILESRHVRGFF